MKNEKYSSFGRLVSFFKKIILNPNLSVEKLHAEFSKLNYGNIDFYNIY